MTSVELLGDDGSYGDTTDIAGGGTVCQENSGGTGEAEGEGDWRCFRRENQGQRSWRHVMDVGHDVVQRCHLPGGSLLGKRGRP